MHTKTNSRPNRGGSNYNKRSSSSSSFKRSGGGSRSGGFGGGRSGGGNRSRGGGGNRGGNGRRIPTFDPSQFINKNPVELKEEVYNAKNTFFTFGLNEQLAKTVESLGITIPSPIQDQIIPEIMDGHDVIGLAETGTGKTAAFLLPLIEKTVNQTTRQTLILAPTRELAIQIDNELRKLGRGQNIFSTICVGGVNINPQIRELRRNKHFIIGTPGRVLDLIKRKNIQPAKITTVVLDEADRMLDMGFIHDIKAILKDIPKERETLFFSATRSDDTDAIVNDFMNNPVTISVKKKDVTNSIEQDVVKYGHSDKFQVLTELFKDENFNKVLIFGAMKHSVEKLSQELNAAGIGAESIHGNKGHSQRQRALLNFKNNKVKVLVATDVAARGIHVDNVTHVINYDLPQTFQDYVHRIGRTGRGDQKGKALTFVQGRSQR